MNCVSDSDRQAANLLEVRHNFEVRKEVSALFSHDNVRRARDDKVDIVCHII